MRDNFGENILTA